MTIPDLSGPLRARIAGFLCQDPRALACRTAPEAEAVVLAAFPAASYDDFVAGVLLARNGLHKPVEVANEP